MFIALTLYLTNRVGFTDVETGYVVAFFAAFMYFMPAALAMPTHCAASKLVGLNCR
jgi:hypothetical protein